MAKILDFETYTDAAGEYRWRLTSPNGKTVDASTEGFRTKTGALRNYSRVRAHYLAEWAQSGSGTLRRLIRDLCTQAVAISEAETITDVDDMEREDIGTTARRVLALLTAPEASGATS